MVSKALTPHLHNQILSKEMTQKPRPSYPVLDIPQLYSKPSAESLLDAISLLAIPPPSWAPEAEKIKPASISEDGVPSYLTRIVSSPLAWIHSDTNKEAIWEAASKRLAERSGRTALPSVSRTFSIPVDAQDSSSSSSCSHTIDIKLYEPSLTGDNLGHKTWVASYLLAKQLPTLLPRYFPSIVKSTRTSSSSSSSTINPNPTSPPTDRNFNIHELGAGTGLFAIAASSLFETTTHLTDLPEIVPNLMHNIAQNAHLTCPPPYPSSSVGGSTVTAAALDWSKYDHDHDPGHHDNHNKFHSSNDDNDDNNVTKQTFDLILAADSLYAPEHPRLLANVIATFLKRADTDADGSRPSSSSRVMLSLPFRRKRRSRSEDTSQGG